MDANDVDDYGYPYDVSEVVEEPEAEDRADSRSAERLEGIQSWLKGEVDLDHAGIRDDAADAALIGHVEQLKVEEAARVDDAAATRAAAAADRAASEIDPPAYAEELREASTPAGALADTAADEAAAARGALFEAEQHEETRERPEWEGIREPYDGGLRHRL
jgi:hypothetical protein